MNLICEKVAKDYLEIRYRPERAEKSLLPSGLIWIARPSADLSCEILDLNDVVIWQEHSKELAKVKPLERCSFDGTIVKIETVDVYGGSKDRRSPKKAEVMDSYEPMTSHPVPEGTRGIIPCTL